MFGGIAYSDTEIERMFAGDFAPVESRPMKAYRPESGVFGIDGISVYLMQKR
jgi:hypothetical protein